MVCRLTAGRVGLTPHWAVALPPDERQAHPLLAYGDGVTEAITDMKHNSTYPGYGRLFGETSSRGLFVER